MLSDPAASTRPFSRKSAGSLPARSRRQAEFASSRRPPNHRSPPSGSCSARYRDKVHRPKPRAGAPGSRSGGGSAGNNVAKPKRRRAQVSGERPKMRRKAAWPFSNWPGSTAMATRGRAARAILPPQHRDGLPPTRSETAPLSSGFSRRSVEVACRRQDINRHRARQSLRECASASRGMSRHKSSR